MFVMVTTLTGTIANGAVPTAVSEQFYG
jgi:hypothetical protein